MPPQGDLPDNQAKVSSVNYEMNSIAGCNGKAGYTNDAFVKDDSENLKNKAVHRTDGDSFDFDDLLPYIGEFGKYQKILFLLMIPFASFVAWIYFSQIFITVIPEQHWCKVPELENLTQKER